ncbi:DUF6378 domain-containing protein [Acinetobacter baumannii]|nr:DUF6378 domain-containing protein [Acinetobacter baumannii]
MNRKALLEATESIVCKDRENDYGSPENNFARIAEATLQVPTLQ